MVATGVQSRRLKYTWQSLFTGHHIPHLRSSTEALGGRAGVQGMDCLPLHWGDRQTAGGPSDHLHSLLSYEEEEGKDPGFLTASPGASSSPALTLNISHP